MKYEELDNKQKMHINGVISKFMDNYIRNHLIWTPEQMYVAFYEEIHTQHREGCFGHMELIDGKWIYPYYVGNKWLTTADAKSYIMHKFETKYIKNNKLARKESPLIERARFGLRWDDNLFYDINWGLKNKSDFQKTEKVENNDMIPWSVEHVEKELMTKYKKDLKSVLTELSKSPIEKKFYEEWLLTYYNDYNNPAIIPEFCGTRKMFYCYKDINGNYSLKTSKFYQNIRYDFAVINYRKQRKLFIELDGHDYHKTKEQRQNDSIKRAFATNEGWQMIVITGTQIHNDIRGVFSIMDDFFSYK